MSVNWAQSYEIVKVLFILDFKLRPIRTVAHFSILPAQKPISMQKIFTLIGALCLFLPLSHSALSVDWMK
jgi:hypothetical protein